MNVYKRDITVVVTDSVGEALTSEYPGGPVHGLMTMMSVVSPTADSAYDVAMYDDGGHLLHGETDLTGSTSIAMEKLCNSALRVSLSNASDGSYKIRLYVRG